MTAGLSESIMRAAFDPLNSSVGSVVSMNDTPQKNSTPLYTPQKNSTPLSTPQSTYPTRRSPRLSPTKESRTEKIGELAYFYY